jgi:hypothetical protein
VSCPLVELITTSVKQSRVIHTDDTRVPVQDPAVKGQCRSGRIWTHIGYGANPYVAYDYTPTAPFSTRASRTYRVIVQTVRWSRRFASFPDLRGGTPEA